MSAIPNFKEHEDRLFEFTRKELQKFAAEHTDSFSYFAFDSNPDYGEVLLCLDTTANSWAVAIDQEKYVTERRQSQHTDSYQLPDHELEWAVQRLGCVVPFNYSTGDFTHQGFADMFFKEWEGLAFGDAFEDSKKTRLTCYAAIVLCNVVDRLVEADAFDSLRKSRPFYCGVNFHDGTWHVVRMINLPTG